MTIVGYRDLDFFDDSNNRVVGKRFFYTEKDPSAVGLVADSFFLNSEVCPIGDISIGDTVQVSYTRKKNVSLVFKIDPVTNALIPIWMRG